MDYGTLFFFFFFNLSIVDLQCCVSDAQQSDSVTYTQAHIFFFGFFLWNIFAGCSRQRVRLLLRLACQSCPSIWRFCTRQLAGLLKLSKALHTLACFSAFSLALSLC